MTTTATASAKHIAQNALQANKDHQYALKAYTERLEAELAAVDKLLAAAEALDNTETDEGSAVLNPGSVKSVGPIPSDVKLEDHPFSEDVKKRQEYLRLTVIHPMKNAELDALADAVRAENHRIHALEAQKRGEEPLVNINAHPTGYFEVNKDGLNWERIASKVSVAGTSCIQRTPHECEIRWLGDRHPQFNHSPWTPIEIAQVKELVGAAEEGEIDWVTIAEKLGTKRTPVDCMRHAIARRTHVWTAEGDRRLLDAVKLYGTGCWMLVARNVSEDVTASQCQSRYIRAFDPSIRRGTWTQDEDDQLRVGVELYGNSWVEVATCVPTRSNEQCRDRWQEKLNPSVSKTNWTEEEEKALLKAVEEVGEGKWKEISRVMGNGRTDSMCRHRYLALKRRKRGKSAASSPATTHSLAVEDIAGSGPGPSRLSRASEEVHTPNEDEVQARSGLNDGPHDDSGLVNIPTSVKSAPKPRRRTKPLTGKMQRDASSAMSTDNDHSQQSAPPVKPKPKPRRRQAAIATETSTSSAVHIPPQMLNTSRSSSNPGEVVQEDAPSAHHPPEKKRGRPRKEVLSQNPDCEAIAEDPGSPSAKRRKTQRKQHDVGGGITRHEAVATSGEESTTQNGLTEGNDTTESEPISGITQGKGRGRGVRTKTETTRRLSRRRP